MEKYIDGYLLSVATAELPAYKKMAGLARTVWLEHGALDYRESRGDELDNEAFASFTKAAGAGPDETVVFAWILFASKAERDRINALAMSDPRLANMECEGIFDPKRMCWGGFTSMIGS
ncbi:DUF1428 domain-containing protein [Achromobacter sp. Marseille-Q0513]|uniref:DUF1428 domain-containing protein n=1 Tax=Achromobacter sp. Marseille-Q0513 TaxID=2829161 RepID=UPI001BA2D2DE|nr:DUF1428 domain-containing protein [Achromobacter sp. Marseille-Q0513]MBR8653059.1 DUF1428 domain-containing protein [Achromobacter sp. Marseille-Q0513]